MPIKQIKSQHDLSLTHAKWLKQKYKNVEHHLLEMDKVFNSFSQVLNKFDNEHGYAYPCSLSNLFKTWENELKTLSISNKWCSTFLYFCFNHLACVKLKSC